jgi:hypothetical protein
VNHLFDVDHLSVERLLADWRWLCSEPVVLLARNAFGDLFLRKESGRVFKLNASIGQLTEITESEERFRTLAVTHEKRQEWFAEDDELSAAQQGLRPNAHQCIGFKIPIMFSESGRPGDAYIADLYEYVSFLGDINRQVSELPDGAKVKLVVKK